MCSRPRYTDLTNMGGIRPCGLMRIIFGRVIKSWYISLNIKFGVNRTFHVLKTHVTTMGGTGPCGPMTIILDSVIKSWYISLNIKFGANRTVCVLNSSIPIGFILEVPDPIDRYSPFSIPTSV